ncbi:MAG: hypothetical protein U0V56_00775 [Actinomycetota bacterium]
MIAISERAREILTRAAASARRSDPEARIRIARDGAGIRSGFAHAPELGDRVIEDADVTVFVEDGLEGTIDVTQAHDRLILRPGGGG